MNVTSHEDFRRLFERVIMEDTGSGGLRHADAAGYVRGLYFAVRPSTVAHPHIFYRFEDENPGAIARDYASIEVALEVDADRNEWTHGVQADYAAGTAAQSVHDFGFGRASLAGKTAAVIARLAARFASTNAQNLLRQSNENSLAWRFRPPTLVSISAAREVDSGHVRQSMRWRFGGQYVTGSASHGPPTGYGMAITIQAVTADGVGGEASDTTIYRAVQPVSVEFSHMHRHIEEPRKRDVFPRRTDVGLDYTLFVRFLSAGVGTANTTGSNPGNVNSSMLPVVSPLAYNGGMFDGSGRVVKVTVTSSVGVVYTYRGVIDQSRLIQSNTGGIAGGFFTLRCSPLHHSGALTLPATPQFGYPVGAVVEEMEEMEE